jgi:hypothetical protein
MTKGKSEKPFEGLDRKRLDAVRGGLGAGHSSDGNPTDTPGNPGPNG